LALIGGHYRNDGFKLRTLRQLVSYGASLETRIVWRPSRTWIQGKVVLPTLPISPPTQTTSVPSTSPISSIVIPCVRTSLLWRSCWEGTISCSLLRYLLTNGHSDSSSRKGSNHTSNNGDNDMVDEHPSIPYRYHHHCCYPSPSYLGVDVATWQECGYAALELNIESMKLSTLLSLIILRASSYPDPSWLSQVRELLNRGANPNVPCTFMHFSQHPFFVTTTTTTTTTVMVKKFNSRNRSMLQQLFTRIQFAHQDVQTAAAYRPGDDIINDFDKVSNGTEKSSLLTVSSTTSLASSKVEVLSTIPTTTKEEQQVLIRIRSREWPFWPIVCELIKAGVDIDQPLWYDKHVVLLSFPSHLPLIIRYIIVP
jgi:ribosomal protein L31